MKVKRIELNNFKRFTHLIVEDIPETVKLVVLVGPNGSGKTSFMEAMNHYHKRLGFNDIGDYGYLSKLGETSQLDHNMWRRQAPNAVEMDFHDITFSTNMGNGEVKGHFYFRSAYRNEPQFSINTMSQQGNPTERIRLSSLIENDQTVSSNYQRIIANSVVGVFDPANNRKTVETLRNELVGKVASAIERVFDDLKFFSLGEPLNKGTFHFTKGITEGFTYRNLSAGEKSAFDLILDMVVQSEYYSNAIYCIDEPEAHMHTKLQGRVLRELYDLVPGESQLWLSTHSIGMLQEAEELEKTHPGTVVFLDFDARDFDTDQLMRPAKIGRAVLNKFYELAFGDFAKLMLPRRIVFCEGTFNGGKRKDFDKAIYTTIFGESYPDTLFISGGSCNDIEEIEERHGAIIKALLNDVEVIKIVDRDDRSETEIKELNEKGIRVLTKRNIESYLLDDEIIKKLCDMVGKSDEYEECLKDKEFAIANSRKRGNPDDDMKSARGEFYNLIKDRLGLTKCGNNADSFIRDTLAPLVSQELKIYKELETEIFGEI